MNKVRNVLKLWPTLDDVAADARIGKEGVKQWSKRNRIPPNRWSLLVKGAQKRGIGKVTIEFLASNFSQVSRQ